MNSSALFKDTVEHINDLAANLDTKKRCYIFLDWNPLHCETDTPESIFWRELINIHILFRECMPDLSKKEVKIDFLQALGFTEKERIQFQNFIGFLRNARLYYCHMLNDAVSVNTQRQRQIQKGFSAYFKVILDIQGDWQFRMETEDWQTALQSLYDHTQMWLDRFEGCLKNNSSDAVYTAWKNLYGTWFKTDEMCRTYLYDAFVHYFELLDDQSTHPTKKSPMQRAGEAMELYKPAIREQYTAESTFDEVGSFEPARLSYELVKLYFKKTV